ncbi:hypothetical protein [Kribbella sp. NPDC003557]|uniref:hypothetical protein n=1 Tax=Kribbella sp. NPDC003557 TaxID=3154449 RepID=UPI0033AD711B
MNAMQEPAAQSAEQSVDWSGLGKVMDEVLNGAAATVGDFNRVFQGSPVAEQWLASVASDAVEPSSDAAPSGDAGIVLLDESDFVPTVEEMLRTRVWPVLERTFGAEQLIAHQQEVIEAVTKAIEPQVVQFIENVTVDASAALIARHTVQGAE